MRRERQWINDLPLCKGLLTLTIFFALQWCSSPMASLRLYGIDMQAYYNVFQILSSFMGLILFLTIGLGGMGIDANDAR